ncbi:hypothetical protein Tco_0688291 [Tanacetum coccineum]
MTTPVEKRNNNRFCEFHGEVGHNTDECMHLKRQIEELVKAGNMSHVIKELKLGNEKDQQKTTKKGEASRKDKPLAILMVQPWKKVARQRIAQSFSLDPEISFPPLEEEDGTEAPMIIEEKIGGHFIHRMARVRKMQAVLSTAHRVLKYLVLGRIVTLRSSKIIPLEWAMVSGSEAQSYAINQVAEERIKVAIHPEYPEQTIAIGSTLMEEGQK